jgi:hypothetical protein
MVTNRERRARRPPAIAAGASRGFTRGAFAMRLAAALERHPQLIGRGDRAVDDDVALLAGRPFDELRLVVMGHLGLAGRA